MEPKNHAILSNRCNVGDVNSIDRNDIVNMKRARLSGRNDDDADDVNRKNVWLYIHNDDEDSDDDAGDVNRKKAIYKQ